MTGAGGARPPAAGGSRWWLRRVGVALVAVGTLLLTVPGGFLAYGAWQEQQLTQQWHGIVSAIPPSVDTVAPAAISAVAPGPLVATPAPAAPVVTKTTATPIAFAMSVPRLGYYSAVVEGVDLGHLSMGPGHYPMTAYPGHQGTVGVAAHNNYWIRFGDLRAGDKIVLEARYGTFTYLVTGSRIVMPDDKTVFADRADGYGLTLTSCWPLWAGVLANRRLVISAQEEGGVG